MRNLINKLRSVLAHYKTKLLLAFLICTMLPILITGIIAYHLSYKIAAKQITDAAISSSDQMNVQLNARITQAENVSDTLQFNMYTLLQSTKLNKTDYINAFSDTRNTLYLYKSTFDFYHIYAFLNPSQLGSREDLYFLSIDQLSNFQISKNELNTIGASSIWRYKDNISAPYIINQQMKSINSIICCRAQVNQSTDTIDYAFMILLDSADFDNVLRYTNNTTSVHTYILTEYNQIVSKSSDSIDDFLSVQDVSKHIKRGEKIFKKNASTFYCLTLNNGWYQITEIKEQYIKSSTNALLKWIVFALLISIFTTFLIILFIVRNLSTKIQLLSHAMNQYQLSDIDNSPKITKFKHPKNNVDFDEIDYLALAFENMKQSIQINLESILTYKISEERLKYQLLQSQINPHFLYNILGSIQNCQALGKLDIASQMITDLTKFYRLSLCKSGELILLKDELEIAVLYLKIEKLCHSNIIEWNIDLADGIDEFAICKFTLQPFLENSILHGISEETPNIYIDISAKYGDSTVIITLKDNGAGIRSEKLKEIKKDLSEKSIHYDRHFGICNVNARISNKYYGDGIVNIESTQGKGTTVIIEYSQIEV